MRFTKDEPFPTDHGNLRDQRVLGQRVVEWLHIGGVAPVDLVGLPEVGVLLPHSSRSPGIGVGGVLV